MLYVLFYSKIYVSYNYGIQYSLWVKPQPRHYLNTVRR